MAGAYLVGVRRELRNQEGAPPPGEYGVEALPGLLPREGPFRPLQAELDLAMLYPAHGPAHREPRKYLRHYLEHRREREVALERALSERPATVGELVRSVYTDVDARMHPVAERSLLAGLEKLEEEGRARPAGDRWELV